MKQSTGKWISIVLIIITIVFILGLHFGEENPFPQTKVESHLGSITIPNTLIYKICWTDNLKEEGKIDDLTEVQTGALCAYDVTQAWKVLIK
jgi:hypothetical protein